jgi:hypothetical protein
MKNTKSKPKRGAIGAAEFDAKFDRGEDISGHLDPSTARAYGPGQSRLDLTSTKVNVDFPKWMVESLDQEANRVGVPRQSLIKLWLAERLEGTT